MSMYCHQCQETAGNKGCSFKQGMCGKSADVANLQDLFIWILKGISFWGVLGKHTGIYDKETAYFIDKGLFATITNANFNKNDFISLIKEGLSRRDALKNKVLNSDGEGAGHVPECAIWSAASDEEIIEKAESGIGGWLRIHDEDKRALKSLILYGLKGIAAYAEHAYQVKAHSQPIYEFIMEALASLIDDSLSVDDLIALVLKTGEMGVETMALLDKANSSEYGFPEMTTVELGVRNNPGILISGHDLVDLEELLEQTQGTGVDVYTHGEMLPAHYYPKFKKYKNLVGNYGNAWWLQKEEIEKFHGPILFTSNCLVPPKTEYIDKVFATGAVGFEGINYIGERPLGGHKDFSKMIELAKKCSSPEEIEKGQIIGGFGHNQLTLLADKIVDAVKSGAIKKFVVMGGCDGRHKTRSYYTEFAEALPKDTVILTAGCAKFRYNKLALGDIGGIPRVLDAGQCNDSYSLAVIAFKLQQIFGLEDVNQLPIVFNIAWYEQKAVLVLLALLSLGFKNIHIGPTLPGFLSPNVAKILVETFGVGGITDVESDIKTMIG